MRQDVKINFKGYKLLLNFTKYQNNGNIAIRAIDVEDGCPFMTVSTNIDETLLEDEVAIKDWSENYGILVALVTQGIIENPHRYVPAGHVKIPICRLREEGVDITTEEMDAQMRAEEHTADNVDYE